MSKKTWADVKKGDVVELGGREYTVTKHKAGKKKADVTVDRKGRAASSTVKLADRVKIVARKAEKRGPLHDAKGTAQRWATKKEHDAVLGESKPLPPGDADVVKPPAKATGDPWETPHGKIERKLDDLLSARLVGISTDESVGYYVPPVNVTTVAAHMAVFHGGIPEACDDEPKMLAAHTAQHAAALKGEGLLAVNHWHTEKRPA